MSVRRKLLGVVLLATLTLSLFLLSVYPAAAQGDQTAANLQAANTAVDQAFNAVLAAEKAGANVTVLLVQLNTADGMLAQAENLYRTGDSSAAGSLAEHALTIAQEVTTSAQNAKQTATVSSQNDLWSTLAFTVIGAVVFVLVLFLVWRWFRRRYIKSLSEAKLK